ncbi:sigma-70 family RNA polymerase sigma factor [Propioniciclava sp. MC1595]|uniref:sigma-70 family RNA polymerase sigma factor n=1 Tax=Propioniciclava sp. MC1595 TaxID=2760308 RepID=UPI001662726F|nr:sigma-70 family RNA polymerase sigma factor [Propioniciclava sp. MC1595]MBB1496152.1 sigma-70 family RNA polymerase sigma factor [Propioniciclava sp. MC1595]QTE25739.1 sigma-70 family RNA polymerase sigma factor [Propioniciclava sp. MC1595]
MSREPGPDAGIEQQDSIRAIAQVLEQLPPSLRDPLLQSMHGHPTHSIAEDLGVSDSTARRRIQRARDHIRDALSSHMHDATWVPLENVADPVLERSQCLYEQTFPLAPGPASGRGPDR